MAMNFFSQFASPIYLGIPLITLAMVLPWLLWPAPSLAWQTNRTLNFQAWFIQQATKQLMLPLNKPAHKWSLILVSLLVFLMSLNMLGLLPCTFTPTTQLSLNLGLAVPLWLATVIIGFRNQPNHSLAHFVPEGTPGFLTPVVVMIETISLFIRPVALAVRLTANLTAGHLLIQLISTAVLQLLSQMTLAGMALGVLSWLVLTPLVILELAVGLIQAYVFVLLLSLYLQENV